jgi:hypothetical protein
MGQHHGEAEDEQIPFWLEGAAGAGHHIGVTAAKRQWRRPPTVAEPDRFVADYVREEIPYREALAPMATRGFLCWGTTRREVQLA